MPKCYFGCPLSADVALHNFPRPLNNNQERVQKWLSVLSEETRKRGHGYISRNVYICDRHFEPKYLTHKRRVTINSYPTINLFSAPKTYGSYECYDAATAESSESSDEDCSTIYEELESAEEFCICCLDRESQLISLEECKHSLYLDALNLPELKEYKQLVCVHCHRVLMKIKSFRDQVLNTHEILTCGAYTVTTPHQRMWNKLTIQETLHTVLPASQEISDEAVPNTSNIEENKNIKTALEIIDRNNQNFVAFGGQLQISDADYFMSVLNPSLIEEVAPHTEVESVPNANNTITISENEFINSEIPVMVKETKRVYLNESLGPRTELVTEETKSNDDFEEEPLLVRTGEKRKTFSRQSQPVKLKKITDYTIRSVQLSEDELNTERMLLSQSESFLKCKFRCRSCLLGFNYKVNLTDHINRKHGNRTADSVTCDICSQVVPSVAAMTEHINRHYTRYECTNCGKRYNNQEEAIRHAIKNECNNTSDNLNAQQIKDETENQSGDVKLFL